VFLFDRDLRLSAAGGRELVQVGWDPEEIVGTRFEDVLPESAFEPLEPHYWAALEGESVSFELEQDGVYYDVQTIPLRDATGTVTAGMAVAQNVTERVERDRKIDQLRERSQALMYTETDTETAGVAVDAAQEVIDAPLSGYHRLSDDGDRLEPGVMAASVGEVFAETPVYDRGAEPGTRAALAWDVFEGGEPLYIDDVGAYEPLTEPSPSGSVLLYPIGTHGLFVVSSAEPNAYDETDRALVDILAGSLTAAMDRVEREQHLRGRERRLEAQNERLSQFASLVSHDLRNPLSVARGRAELARRTGDAEHFDAVARAHERMDRLIEELLQLTVESEDGSAFESLDLGDTATASWGSVDTGDASLVVETTRRVRADENRLRQVFENLFRNSVEHGSTTPRLQARGDSVEHGSTDSRPQAGDAVEHGSVDVEGADHAPLTVTVGGLPDGFYVEDTGPGIEPRRRETVFEAGHSSGSGTGLGLHIVRNVADEHGWTVVVTDGCQGGARFEFTDVEIEDGTGTDRE
jgi:signal transduction histidine kinase